MVEHIGRSAYIWLDRGKKGKTFRGRQQFTIIFGDPLEITRRQWGRMVAMASAGARPPEAHIFLRDARHAKNAGHHRRSVLDSATAAELGLAPAIVLLPMCGRKPNNSAGWPNFSEI